MRECRVRPKLEELVKVLLPHLKKDEDWKGIKMSKLNQLVDGAMKKLRELVSQASEELICNEDGPVRFFLPLSEHLHLLTFHLCVGRPTEQSLVGLEQLLEK